LRLCRNRKNAHRTHTNIHASVGFEPTISVLERAKTVRALDCAATAIGFSTNDSPYVIAHKDTELKLREGCLSLCENEIFRSALCFVLIDTVML
jgi:hypothetical protein